MKLFKKNLKLILGIFAICFIFIFVLNNSLNSSKYKIYQSKSLSFSTESERKFKVEDTGITFIMTNSLGEISIIRNGTQFNNLESYLNNQDKTSDIQIYNSKKNEKIKTMDSVVRNENILNKKFKVYYLYINSNVYVLSTSSPELYDELDQIAQSFKYTGY